jgi:hypothetical protein
MIVKWLGCLIGIMGTAIGAITVYLETGDFFHGLHIASPIWTTIAISIGFVASLLLLWQPRMARWLLLLVAIAGVYGNYTMWEGPGTFYLASALIAFTSLQKSRTVTER